MAADRLPDGILAAPGLGDRIREARYRMGLSREDFAAKIGVSPWTLGSWERNEQQPSVHSLGQVARSCTHVSMDWLRRGDTDE